MDGFGTGYTETEALLRAQQDAEADSGNIDGTVSYLVEHFLPNEARMLERACEVLDRALTVAMPEIERRFAAGETP